MLPLQQHKLLYADTVYQQAISGKDSLKLAEACYLYGKTYEAAGDLLTSQRWFLKSLAILEPRGDSFALSRLYFRLSRNEARQGHYPETRQYARLCLDVARRIGSAQALGRAYSVMADLYTVDWSNGGKRPAWPRPKPDSVDYYRKADESIVATSQTGPLIQMDRYSAEGRRLWYEKHNPAGMAYLQKALELAINEKEITWQFRLMREMADMYLNMNKPERAWQLLRRADRLLAQSPFANSQADRVWLEKGYRGYYLNVGDWHRAYEHSEKIHEQERNNYITDRDGAVTRLGVEYETEKKEVQLKAQQKELALRTENLHIQERFIWATSALLLVTAGMSLIFFRLYRKNQRISAHNATLVNEQNHRVKNNLQVVSSLLSLQANRLADEAARKAVEESQLRVEAMAILHRRLYDGQELGHVNVAEFIPELVETVFQTYGYYQARLVYDLPAARLPADYALPIGLILNELASNACKYAFPDHADPFFRVDYQQSKKQVTLRVTDNGPGMHLPSSSEEALKRSTRFGLRLIQMQVDQLRGTHAFANQEGTLFTLHFTLHT